MDVPLRPWLLGGLCQGGAGEAAAAGRASARSLDSGVHAKQPEYAGGTVRLGGDGAGRGGAEVRLLRLEPAD
jgi:hypothetical protein